jgi:hypothetical protein
MPTAWQTWPVKFQGGWRTDLGRIDQGLQAPGSATILRNFEPSVNGGYARILGYDKFSSTDVDVLEDNPVLGVVVADETTALVRKETKYYKGTGTTWTSVLTAVTPGAVGISFDVFNFNGTEKIVVVDGYNDPAYYAVVAGTMAYDSSAPTGATGSSIVKVFRNAVFFAKGPLLTFTAPYAETDYDPGNGAGEINIGGDITGLAVFREQLIIFTIDKIWRLTGDTSENFVLQPIADNTGCLSQYTIQEVGGDILYLGPDGIRWLSATARNNDFGLDRASSNIQEVMLDLIASDNIYSSLVIRSKNQYRIFNYDVATPKALSKGYIATKFSGQDVSYVAWAEIVGMKVRSAHSRQFRDREVILFSSEDGLVYRMESGNSFDGGDINAVFETPYMPINDPRVRFTAYKHSLYMKLYGALALTGQLKFDYLQQTTQPPLFNITGGSGSSVYGESLYGTAVYSTTTSNTALNQVLGSGFVMALRYESNDTNAPYLLDYALVEFMTNERR